MAKKRASKSQTPLLWHDDLPEVEAKVESDVPPPSPPPAAATRRDATQEGGEGSVRKCHYCGSEDHTEVLLTEDERLNANHYARWMCSSCGRQDGWIPWPKKPDTLPSLVLDSKSKRPPKREKGKPEVETFDRNSLPDVIIESRFLASDEEWDVVALEIVGMPAGMYRGLWGLEGEWIGWE